MPELPEVECIRLCLQRECVGSTATLHKLAREDIVGSIQLPRGNRVGGGPKTPKISLLNGATLVGFERKGKQLALKAACGRSLIVRLGMSGQVLLVNEIDLEMKHIHAVWLLQSNKKSQHLLFRDPRRFGSILPCKNNTELNDHWCRLGPDALTLSSLDLSRIAKNRSVAIKALLLNQTIVCGLGNIYVDEALFMAKIHPKKMSKNLSKKEIEELAFCIRKVLERAIKAGGTTLRDYCVPDGSFGSFQKNHLVYGRQGLLCTLCQSVILGDVIAGRTTAFCPTCQVL
jgi:formamidopyrimidine-DNA glycosylase